jgi:hypothetical protein
MVPNIRHYTGYTTSLNKIFQDRIQNDTQKWACEQQSRSKQQTSVPIYRSWQYPLSQSQRPTYIPCIRKHPPVMWTAMPLS